MIYFLGIDNGVSGSIGIISRYGSQFFPTPTVDQLDYTKARQRCRRVDVSKMWAMLRPAYENGPENVHVMIERPMVNPTRFKATKSALRALEATLIVLERMHFAHRFIDSKEWQKDLLPQGTVGPVELKRASKEIGIRYFPHLREAIEKQGDADGLLIAEHCRRTYK